MGRLAYATSGDGQATGTLVREKITPLKSTGVSAFVHRPGTVGRSTNPSTPSMANRKPLRLVRGIGYPHDGPVAAKYSAMTPMPLPDELAVLQQALTECMWERSVSGNATLRSRTGSLIAYGSSMPVAGTFLTEPC